MNSVRRAGAALLGLALLAGCATKPQGTVVLLPDPDGRDTAVLVKQDGGEMLLDKPYAAAELTNKGPLKASSSAEQVRSQFGAALAARPLPPQQFTLYFIEGKDEFTDESKRVIDSVLAEIAKRPVPDVLVIGHTDTVGTDAFNDLLSKQRGEVVRKALLARGIQIENVVVVGRGEREPIVPTADNVAEPRNRRVEILVR
ncbi:MAG: OmpA family protein [Burkholderiaceae bacterium]|nr:OmpA family protein [Burkholderiaceae bacterium]MCU0963852.1 OmpA family protein [Burkholderiaceae bacterium]